MNLLSNREARRRNRTLWVPIVAVTLSVSPAWAHDVKGIQADGSGEYVSQMMGADVPTKGTHIPAAILNRHEDKGAKDSHQHTSALPEVCPQLTGEAELDGLKECVTVLTQQISDLLKLIMNLSDALAESRNELLQRAHEGSRLSPTPAMANNS